MFLFLYLVLHKLVIVNGYHELNVLSNIIIDDYGGRHTKITIGTDNLPFMIWLSDNKGAVGVAHCEDVRCNKITKHYIDSAENADHANYTYANQVCLKISPITHYPQILYSLTTSSNGTFYYLRFVTCYNHDCTKWTVKDVIPYTFSSTGNVYVDFIYNQYQDNQIFITYNRDPYGLYWLICNVEHIECGRNSGGARITPYGLTWYVSMYLINEHYELLFMYYDAELYNLNYAMVNINQLLVEEPFIAEVDGCWLATTSMSLNGTYATQIALVYVDSYTGYYKYGLCNIDGLNYHLHCNETDIDKINSSDVYPDILMDSSFNPYPISTYFDRNSLKITQCNNLGCNDNNTFMQQLSNGSYGYGRDSSIQWFEKYNLMYISFLDYNGDGNDTKARLLISTTDGK